MKQMKLTKSLSEIVDYNSADFPVYCRHSFLSDYPGFAALCHRHADFEFTYVISGKLDFFVDGEFYTVRKGECIFVNSDRFHYGFSQKKEDCEIFCILFSPSLLRCCTYLQEKYISDFQADENKKSFLLRNDGAWQTEILEKLKKIYDSFFIAEKGFELRVLSRFWGIFYLLYRNGESQIYPAETNKREREALAKMLSYIEASYSRECSPDKIAAAGAVCRSKCFSLFKKQLHTTPVGFLTEYRLQKSVDLFFSDRSFTEIAYACGFSSASYYAKVFKEFFGCTPREYKKTKCSRYILPR